jgi:hypothetical protein
MRTIIVSQVCARTDAANKADRAPAAVRGILIGLLIVSPFWGAAAFIGRRLFLGH